MTAFLAAAAQHFQRLIAIILQSLCATFLAATHQSKMFCVATGLAAVFETVRVSASEGTFIYQYFLPLIFLVTITASYFKLLTVRTSAQDTDHDMSSSTLTARLCRLLRWIALGTFQAILLFLLLVCFGFFASFAAIFTPELGQLTDKATLPIILGLLAYYHLWALLRAFDTSCTILACQLLHAVGFGTNALATGVFWTVVIAVDVIYTLVMTDAFWSLACDNEVARSCVALLSILFLALFQYVVYCKWTVTSASRSNAAKDDRIAQLEAALAAKDRQIAELQATGEVVEALKTKAGREHGSQLGKGDRIIQALLLLLVFQHQTVTLDGACDKIGALTSSVIVVNQEKATMNEASETLIKSKDEIIAQKDSTIATAVSTVESKEEEIAQANSTIAANASSLENQNALIAKHEATISRNCRSLAAKNRVIATRGEGLKQKDGEIIARDASIDDKQAIIFARDTSIDEQKAAIDKMEHSIKELAADNDRVIQQHAETVLRLDSAVAEEKLQLQSRITKYEEQIATIMSDNESQREADKTKMSAQHAHELTAVKQVHETQLAGKVQDMSKLKLENITAAEEIMALRKELQAERVARSDTEKRYVRRIQAQALTLADTINSLGSSMARRQEVADAALRKQAQEHAATLKQAHARVENLEGQIATQEQALRRQEAESRAAMQEECVKMYGFKTNIASLEAEKQEYMTALQEKDREITRLGERLSEMQNNIRDLQRNLQAKDTEIRRLQGRASDLAIEKDTMRSELQMH